MLAALAASAAGCSRVARDSAIRASGTVLVEDVAVPVPRRSTSQTGTPAPALVTSTAVAPGTRVTAGQTLAVLDGRTAAADLASADAALLIAQSTVALLEEKRSEIDEGASTVASRRASVDRTIADLQATRADVAARLARSRAMLTALESAPPPPAPGAADIASLRAAVAKLTTALASLDSGLAKAKAGRARLVSASATLAGAREEVAALSGVAESGVAAAEAGLAVARIHVALDTIVAPVDGWLLECATAGDVLAPGAPVAIVRPDAPQHVRIWLSPATARTVETGDPAYIRFDSLDEAIPGSVARIGSKATFPPTSLSTRVIHLIRAVPTDIVVTGGTRIPAGVPADVTIDTEPASREAKR